MRAPWSYAARTAATRSAGYVVDEVGAGRNDHRVRLGQVIETVWGGGQERRPGPGPSWLRGADLEVVPGVRQAHPGSVEDCAGNGGLEDRHPLGDRHRDLESGHVTNLADIVIRATRFGGPGWRRVDGMSLTTHTQTVDRARGGLCRELLDHPRSMGGQHRLPGAATRFRPGDAVRCLLGSEHLRHRAGDVADHCGTAGRQSGAPSLLLRRADRVRRRVARLCGRPCSSCAHRLQGRASPRCRGLDAHVVELSL